MKKTVIISGFPGVGKTHFFKENPNTIDSDSSTFDKRDFPENYLTHIKNNIGKVENILVSSHKEVREALVDNNLKFVLVYPDKSLKDEYLKRYEKRGSDESFIKLLSDNWDNWIDEIEKQEGCIPIKLKKGQYLSNVKFKRG